MNCTPMEQRLLHALECMLEWTTADSLLDQQTDARLREEYRAARARCDTTAVEARAVFTGKG